MKRIAMILTVAALAAVALTADIRPKRQTGITCYTHCYPSGMCMTSCF